MRHARVLGFAGLAVAALAAAVAIAQTEVVPLPEAEPVQTAPLDASATAALAKAKGGDPEADVVRRLVQKCGGGHATLIRAPLSWRNAVAVFEPQPPALAALSRRLKAEFDTKGVLNPGRMG